MDKEKSVLVTGGAGYIGSHIVLTCLDAGYHVIVIDRDEKACKHLQKCLSRRKKIKIFNADIDNDVYMDGVFQNENIGAIIHCAADISVPESVDNPLKYYFNNTSKSIKLLEKAKRYGVNNFVFSCTAAVYGEPKGDVAKSIPETQPCRPINAYGESKLMFETILKRYSEVNPNFKYTSLRYFNVAGNDIGNRVQDIHWRQKGNIIPKILSSVIDGKGEFRIFGTDYDTSDGSCIRDYIHPTDLANAHLLCIEKDVKGVFNLGNKQRCFCLGNCQRSLCLQPTLKLMWFMTREEKAIPKVLVANPTIFIKETGWEPAYNLGEIVRTAYKAYRKVK